MSRNSKVVMVETDFTEKYLSIIAITRQYKNDGRQETRIYLPWQAMRVKQFLSVIEATLTTTEQMT